MSDATRAALADAIQAHIADEYEDSGTDAPLLTEWVIAVASVRMNAEVGATSYSWWSNGPFHSVRGLVSMLTDWLAEAD